MRRYTINKYIPRMMVLLLCVALLLPAAPTALAQSGTCGDNLSWTFDGSTLTITGSGPMDNFSENGAPWNAYREQIINISLPEELTRIGTWAFADCTNLLSVSIPGSVEIIDEYAFRRCGSMTIVTLHEGIRTIGICAFEQCEALADLRLPNTLTNIHDHAFYMCDSLTYVTIPGTVKTIGSGVFSYCENLIRVDVNANVKLPSWSFYGCDKLQVVSVQGVSVDPESLKITTPPQGIPGLEIPEEDPDTSDEEQPSTFDPTEPTESTTPAEPTEPVPAPDAGLVSGEHVTTGESGEQTVEKTVVTQTENSTTTTTMKTPVGQQGTTTTTITSTVMTDRGWQDVIDKVNSATIGGNSNPVNVTVYLPNTDLVSADVLEKFTGKNVLLSIQTQSGSQVTLDCTKLDAEIKKDLDVTYTIVPAQEIPEEMAGCTVYQLKFHTTMDISAEMVIRLPGGHAFSTATLYQLKRGKPEQLQSVLVDGAGDSHWYLRTVDDKTDYLIGIDVPGAVEDIPIIPAEMHDVYKVANVYDGVEYVVTGRTSSWNMELGQVMGILAASMVAIIVVVGIIMFMWNKNRLKKGYVPQWDDEEDE